MDRKAIYRKPYGHGYALTQEGIEEVKFMRSEGHPDCEIAKVVGVSTQTIARTVGRPGYFEYKTVRGVISSTINVDDSVLADEPSEKPTVADGLVVDSVTMNVNSKITGAEYLVDSRTRAITVSLGEGIIDIPFEKVDTLLKEIKEICCSFPSEMK